jgi:hypothetical protein
VLTLAAFIAYTRWLRPAPAPGVRLRLTERRGASLLALLLIPVLLFAGFAVGKVGTRGPEETGPLGAVALPPASGTAQAGQPSVVQVPVPAQARGNLSFLLTWTDEAPSSAGATNRPDAFRLEVFDAAGASLARKQAPNPQGGEGRVVVIVAAAGLAGTTLRAEVTLVSSGDQVVTVPLQGPVTLAADDANAWELQPAMEAGTAPTAS